MKGKKEQVQPICDWTDTLWNESLAPAFLRCVGIGAFRPNEFGQITVTAFGAVDGGEYEYPYFNVRYADGERIHVRADRPECYELASGKDVRDATVENYRPTTAKPAPKGEQK